MKGLIFFLLLELFLISQSYSQSFPDKPSAISAVSDFADLFTDKEESEILKMRNKLVKKKNVDLSIISVKSLNGMTPEVYTYKLAESWQLDKNKTQLIIVIKPKYPEEKGDIYIATGYGYIAVSITDDQLKDIIENFIIPKFKNNKIYEGVIIGLEQIINNI